MTSTSILSIGAEAEIRKKKILGKWVVEKTRVPKTYRNELLDSRLRKERTTREARMLHEVKKIGIPTPILYALFPSRAEIIMEFIPHPRLKHGLLGKHSIQKKKEWCALAGNYIARMHAKGIVHGDLTTSNVLVNTHATKSTLFFIDFGLAFHSTKIEDLAVDLVNLKKTFTATHSNFKSGWGTITQGYLKGGGNPLVLKHVEAVEKRIRYA
ncbi:MAG: KEOPS complex kinase/ATPase Bud32 [Candidatus Diapherotrites archaeon]